MNKWFPSAWIPLYSMVTFTRIPYHEVIEQRAKQDRLLSRIGLATTVLGICVAAVYCKRHQASIQMVANKLFDKVLTAKN